MYAYVITIFSIISVLRCVTVNRISASTPRVIGKSKIELEHIEIECGLGDIIVISAPVTHAKEKLYYLTNPKGEVKKLPIKYNNSIVRKKWKSEESYDNNLIVKYIETTKQSVIAPEQPFSIYNVNNGEILPPHITKRSVDDEESLNANEFEIGPLGENDSGNWLLSVYMKDIDQKWIELFQVISIEVIEPAPMNVRDQKLNLGDTFHLSFAYPILHLQTCQLVVPSSTFDRYYERNVQRKNSTEDCGFVIKNVTKEDEGLWKIIGVGRIIYEATCYLTIEGHKT